MKLLRVGLIAVYIIGGAAAFSAFVQKTPCTSAKHSITHIWNSFVSGLVWPVIVAWRVGTWTVDPHWAAIPAGCDPEKTDAWLRQAA